MSVYEIASEGIAPMRQLHDVSFQRILAHPRVHPALIGIVGYDEVWRGLACALEPAIARFIGEREFESIVLMAGVQQAAVGNSQSSENVTPFYGDVRDDLSFYVFSSAKRNDHRIQRHSEFPAAG